MNAPRHAPAGTELVRMTGIMKSFPGVMALRGARVDLHAGEVHALMGENGAGKSTLMKILSGIYRPDAGTVEVAGTEVTLDGPRAAQAQGIGIIHQELALMNDLTVAQNIFIGRESSSFRISDRDLNRRAQALIDEFEIGVDPRTLLRDLSVGKAQMVEIARAMSFAETQVLILDEPSAALSEGETIELLAKVDQMRARGVSVVYISHRMNEIMQVADRVTVLRDGDYVDTLKTASCTVDDIIKRMVGREIDNSQKQSSDVPADAEVVLRARGLTSSAVRDVSFELRRGEILGFAGLVGAGRTETMQILCGADPWGTGEIEVHGMPMHFTHPKQAISAGIAYLSEDRKRYGLVLNLSVTDNTVLASYDKLSTGWVVRQAECRKAAERYVAALRTKTPSVNQIVKNLSGGNQQKVVLAKWLKEMPEVLILDEPTRGVDVGGKAEIYRIINELAGEGVAIIMISSELPEVLGVSDRIAVMCEGTLMDILDTAEATQENIMALASGTNEK